jgi:hypothetical protein
MFRRKVAVGVVLHHMEVVRVGQLQNTVRAGGVEAVAGRVVQHAHAHKQLGRMGFGITGHHLQIGAIGAARHRQNAHAQRIQPGELYCPARFLDHHVVARAHQSAADDVQRMGRANGGDDLCRCGLYGYGLELLRKGTAQTRVARGLAVLQRQIIQLTRIAKPPHRAGQKTALQPLRWQHAHAGLWLVTHAVEHAAYQGGRVERRAMRLRLFCRNVCRTNTRWHSCIRGVACAFAHIETTVAPGLYQPLGQQLVVRLHHRRRAHTLLLRALAHRWEFGPGRQQSVPYALGKAQGQLLSQRLGAAFHEHQSDSGKCASRISNTVFKMFAKTVLQVSSVPTFFRGERADLTRNPPLNFSKVA